MSYAVGLALEAKWPFRKPQQSRLQHLSRNLIVSAFNFAPLLLVGWALRAVSAPSLNLTFKAAIVFLTYFLIYDLINYLVHRSLHQFGGLFRIHRVHHTELDLDVSSAFYFHPLEALYRGSIQILIVYFCAVPLNVLLSYQIWVTLALFFAHLNATTPRFLARWFSWLLVLPQDHFIHHSREAAEQNTNFGIGLMTWDHLFKTYRSTITHSLGLNHSQLLPLTVEQTLRDPFTTKHEFGL